MMEALAVFPPLAAFVVTFLLGRVLGARLCQFLTCAGMFVAAFVSMVLYFDVTIDGSPRTVMLMNWFTSGSFSIDWALRIDQLTVVMMCVINIVSACVHVYSVGYMSHDESKGRFMSYLSLFTFAMLMLVTSGNLLQLFFGWEGVGLASYLLIGFWNEKHSANAAAVKAFVVNRVGDLGLALGIMTVFVVFGTVQFDQIFAQAGTHAYDYFLFFGHRFLAMNVICLLLFMGACGKSAQLGLHTWLPDAMEGPTPVSALIHAATMVTAGVFLVARMSPLFEYAPEARMVVTVIGASTAFIAATIGLTQFDIKRVIAYSTMSQLGYMFFALGVSAYGAAVFHLMTHAFFKALLFLGAGSVIHAMSGEQDMRRMGGLRKLIPTTYVLMWIGSLALCGIPFFAGYYSKDIILEAAFANHTGLGLFAYWMGIAAAFMTAFYSWRLIIMTFHGRSRAGKDVLHHVHESPPIMISPLVVLATGAILAGFIFHDSFVGEPYHERNPAQISTTSISVVEAQPPAGLGNPAPERIFGVGTLRKTQIWGRALFVLPENDSVLAAHHIAKWAKFLPTVMGLGGILLAYFIYARKRRAATLARRFRPLHRLFFRKWYFDELYDLLLVRNAWRIGRFFSVRGDRGTIDRFGPDGFAAASRAVAGVFSRFQSGYLYHYAFVMMVGVIGVVSWFIYKMGM
jgi:NADH-quinone oxidoreductase subunit L